MEARFCHNCGGKLQENARFCGVCGTPVFQFAPAETPAPQVQPEPAAVIPEPELISPVPVEDIFEPSPVEENLEPVVPAPAEEVAEPVFVAPVPVEEEIPEPVIPAPVEEVAEPVFVAPVPVEEEIPEPVVPAPVEEVVEPVPVVPAPVEEVVEPVFVAPTPVEEVAEPVFVAPTPVEEVAEPVFVAPTAPVTYAYPPAAPVLKMRDVYPRRGAGRTILAVILCIFIFLWSFAALVLYDVRNATSGQQLSNNLETVVKELDLTKLPASSIVEDTADPDQSLIEWALEEIATTSEGTITVSEKDAKKFLEESTIDDFIYDKLGVYMEDLYSDSGKAAISKEEIVTLLNDNTALIEKTFGITVESAEVEEFANQIDELGVLEYLEPTTLKTEAAPVYYAVQIGLSYWVIGFFGILALISMLMLAGTNKWKMLRTSRDIGVTLTVLGALMSVAALFTKILPDVWASIFGSNKLIGTVSATALYSGLIPALIVAGVGVLLILICIIGKAIIFKSAKNRSK